MREKLSKFLLVIGVAALTLIGYHVSYTFAASIPEFTISSKWSDITTCKKAGYWSNATMVQCENLSSSFSVNSYVNSAASRWNVVEGVDCSYTTSTSLANSTFYSGTKAQLNAVGFVYASDTNGQTFWGDSVLKKQDTGHLYKLYNVTSAYASVCTDGNYGETSFSGASSSFLTIVYNHLVTHEMGHLLGYWGHSDISDTKTKDVMYAYESIVYSLSSDDKSYMTYIYDLAD